ncbi:quinone oxidoreductase family protein [Phycicoccus sonneratiae]|uniref:NAD(P)-dependent alcohol dehydrogenase n=1 Tax=Phycicoccus sonneratiae TaxID=2807628 RepID=A0ABS2CK87_9MICO|nr:NAD(P)-dependent alcohol dehydrogenase [Phycicoccus sonneraticus]MBM6400292.1 NAD(P)-dependent alcohol dehydrogenase [Phycicoccus sonneraticus]
MRAAVTSRYGPPEVVRVEEVPDPVPGPADLLVRVHWSTVNRTDCAYRTASPWFIRSVAGWRGPRHPVGGTELAGVVEAVGADVGRFAPGDRVFAYVEGRFGAHAELALVAASAMVARVPDGVDLASAAAATEGGHYAWSFVRRCGLRSGQSVLVHGATGAIGSAAVQLLVDAGMRVTATAPTAHLDLVAGLGPERVVDWQREPLSAAGGPFDAVLDTVGTSTFAQCRPLLAPGGVYSSSELGPLGQNVPLAAIGLAQKGRRVVFPVPFADAEMTEYLRSRLESGAFRPVLDRTYVLDDVVDAYRYAGSGQKVGTVLLELAGGD